MAKAAWQVDYDKGVPTTVRQFFGRRAKRGRIIYGPYYMIQYRNGNQEYATPDRLDAEAVKEFRRKVGAV